MGEARIYPARRRGRKCQSPLAINPRRDSDILLIFCVIVPLATLAAIGAMTLISMVIEYLVATGQLEHLENYWPRP